MSGNIISSANLLMGSSVVIGMVIGLSVGMLIRMLLKKKGKEAKYDERQKMEQARASSIAFRVLLLWNLLAGAIYGMGILTVEPIVTFFLGAIMALAVYAIYCIIKEAYIGINQNAMKWGIIYLILGIYCIYCSRGGATAGLKIELGCGVMCAMIACTVLAKVFMGRRSNGMSDDEQ